MSEQSANRAGAGSAFVPFRSGASKRESAHGEFQTAFSKKPPATSAESPTQDAANDTATGEVLAPIPEGASAVNTATPAATGPNGSAGDSSDVLETDGASQSPLQTDQGVGAESNQPSSPDPLSTEPGVDPAVVTESVPAESKSPAPEVGAVPKLTFEKSGDSVRMIRVECSCGKIHEIDCLYEDVAPVSD